MFDSITADIVKLVTLTARAIKCTCPASSSVPIDTLSDSSKS